MKKNIKVNLQVGRTILQFSTQDRLNFIQKCLCLYSQLKKDESNAIVHYDEAKKYFPREFTHLFFSVKKQNQPLRAGNPNQESLNFQVDTLSNRVSNHNNLRDSMDNQNNSGIHEVVPSMVQTRSMPIPGDEIRINNGSLSDRNLQIRENAL